MCECSFVNELTVKPLLQYNLSFKTQNMKKRFALSGGISLAGIRNNNKGTTSVIHLFNLALLSCHHEGTF